LSPIGNKAELSEKRMLIFATVGRSVVETLMYFDLKPVIELFNPQVPLDNWRERLAETFIKFLWADTTNSRIPDE
jgi:hypothetical protein